ncbi:hypothetical protein ACPCSP_30715 [Streptomyces cinereoruber]|uniref:hypothetical protein n=1 Tax=Streptomyces cinereoruber TaxID=67260 RepID=UPI003C2ADE46
MDKLHVVRFAPVMLNPADDYDDTNDEKTAYASFGLALFGANVMEAEIVNAFAMSRIITAREQGEQLVTDPWAKGFKEAVKNLVPKVCRKAGADQRIVDDLLVAVDRRNYLVHRFWYERIEELVSDRRRARLITELQHDHRLFVKMTDLLRSTVHVPLLANLDISQDLLDAELDRIRRRIEQYD